MEKIFTKAQLMLPQAVWYDILLPDDGAVLLETFVMKTEDHPEYNTTHIRLMLLSGDVQENWESLLGYQQKIYQKILKEIPKPPENAQVFGHIACENDKQIEYGYAMMREISEKIAKEKNWTIADVSINKPIIRKTENLDIPFYKLFDTKYQREDLANKPFGLLVKEKEKGLKISFKSPTKYVFVSLIPIIALLLLLSSTTLQHWSIWLTSIMNFVILIGVSLIFLLEKELLIDVNGIRYYENKIIAWAFKIRSLQDFIPWNEIEEIHTMNASLKKSSIEQLAVISDSNMICYKSPHSEWIWKLVMIWISEHKQELLGQSNQEKNKTDSV